jgi:hypothetical protein
LRGAIKEQRFFSLSLPYYIIFNLPVLDADDASKLNKVLLQNEKLDKRLVLFREGESSAVVGQSSSVGHHAAPHCDGRSAFGSSQSEYTSNYNAFVF